MAGFMMMQVGAFWVGLNFFGPPPKGNETVLHKRDNICGEKHNFDKVKTEVVPMPGLVWHRRFTHRRSNKVNKALSSRTSL